MEMTLNLKTYLIHKGVSLSEFAESVGYSRAHLYGVIVGKNNPGKKLVKLIEKMTDGNIKAENIKVIRLKEKSEKTKDGFEDPEDVDNKIGWNMLGTKICNCEHCQNCRTKD
jgi:predicted transcriptional regulator